MIKHLTILLHSHRKNLIMKKKCLHRVTYKKISFKLIILGEKYFGLSVYVITLDVCNF